MLVLPKHNLNHLSPEEDVMDRGKPWNREMLRHHGTTDSEEK